MQIGEEFIRDYNNKSMELGFPEFKIIPNSEYVEYLKNEGILEETISNLYNPDDKYVISDPMGDISFNEDAILSNCNKMILGNLLEEKGIKL
jgi:hypothetical protein